MICVNDLTDLKCCKRAVLEPLLVLLSPFAPHLSEELWQRAGKAGTIFNHDWPNFNPDFLVESTISYPVSINGKTRMKIELPLNMQVAEIESIVLADGTVKKWLEGLSVKKVVIVTGKIVNIVAG